MQYVKSQEDALEIVNDAFMVIWEKRDELKIDSALKPYLYTVVRNKCLNLIKKKKLDAITMEDGFEAIADVPDPQEIMEAKQTEELVNHLIELLPPKCKQIFILSRKEFLSNKDIAAILEISDKTVENQITIAIRFIKKGLGAYQSRRGDKLPLVLFPWVIAMLLS